MTRELTQLIESAFEYANALLNRTADLLRSPVCDHSHPYDWRPALADGGPARICRYCKKIEPLTREVFYALFGERVYRLLVEAEKDYR